MDDSQVYSTFLLCCMEALSFIENGLIEYASVRCWKLGSMRIAMTRSDAVNEESNIPFLNKKISIVVIGTGYLQY